MEAELECLQNEGIIEPVQFADWVAPIVPAVKADKKSLRICGDFKLTANQASKLDHHPIPKIEDCLQSCQFPNSKLDMSRAHQQTPLEEESKKHHSPRITSVQPTSVWSFISPGGIPKDYGVSFERISNIVVYLDDILVTGSSDTDH